MSELAEKLQLTRLSDHEYSGRLNRATSDGATFGLLLSMIRLDVMSRPELKAQPEQTVPSSFDQELPLLQNYPVTRLSAATEDWAPMNVTSQLLHTEPTAARLWQCMHPSPLAQHNDVSRVDDEIIANCPLHVQQAYQQPETAPQTAVEVDETGLYDILQTLHA